MIQRMKWGWVECKVFIRPFSCSYLGIRERESQLEGFYPFSKWWSPLEDFLNNPRGLHFDHTQQSHTLICGVLVLCKQPKHAIESGGNILIWWMSIWWDRMEENEKIIFLLKGWWYFFTDILAPDRMFITFFKYIHHNFTIFHGIFKSFEVRFRFNGKRSAGVIEKECKQSCKWFF